MKEFSIVHYEKSIQSGSVHLCMSVLSNLEVCARI
uniref:Uncharacterized protein n=1 Tax=Anguilla anguilla TaxID=7936 RepID=A0A0E9TP31_ANGAN